MDDGYRIERFTLDEADFGRLAALVETAFVSDAQDDGGTILFTEETFRLMFGSPYARRDLFVRAIHEPTGEPVGFLGGIERPLVWGSQRYAAAIPAWAAVHPDHRGRGLAARMGGLLFDYAAERGFDVGFALFEPEAHGIDMARAVARDKGRPMRDLLTIRWFLIRVFDVDRVAEVVRLARHERAALRLLEPLARVRDPAVRPMQERDHERVIELMDDHIRRNELAVIRDPQDLSWYLRHPDVVGAVHEGPEGRVDGFAIAWEMQLAGLGGHVPFGWLDLLHLHRLAPRAAADVLRMLCRLAHGRGWRGLQTPHLPYFSMRPLLGAKVVPYPKKLVVSLLPLRDMPLPKRVSSFYLDWR